MPLGRIAGQAAPMVQSQCQVCSHVLSVFKDCGLWQTMDILSFAYMYLPFTQTVNYSCMDLNLRAQQFWSQNFLTFLYSFSWTPFK